MPSEEVKQKEIEIRAMTFHPADPMILLYNPIEKLRTMAESASIPYTANQLLDMGLTVIRNTRDFEKALGEWELLPTNQKTWVKFKSHFTEAQKQLKAIRGPTMQQAGYHHANMLAEQLKSDMERRDNSSLSTPSLASSDCSTITPSQHANSVQMDPVQMEMLKILQQMQQTMLSATTYAPTPQGQTPHGNQVIPGGPTPTEQTGGSGGRTH